MCTCIYLSLCMSCGSRTRADSQPQYVVDCEGPLATVRGRNRKRRRAGRDGWMRRDRAHVPSSRRSRHHQKCSLCPLSFFRRLHLTEASVSLFQLDDVEEAKVAQSNCPMGQKNRLGFRKAIIVVTLQLGDKERRKERKKEKKGSRRYEVEEDDGEKETKTRRIPLHSARAQHFLLQKDGQKRRSRELPV